MTTERHASVLILGAGEIASAIARELFLADHIVALHQASPPSNLRRKMAFSDAWFDGSAVLEGVEARRADLVAEFLLGLRSRMFIPLLTHPLQQILDRWPWEAVIDAGGRREPSNVKNLAGLTIGVGGAHIAGETCDLVVETDGADPGAISRPGDVRPPRRDPDKDFGCAFLEAPAAGIFSAMKSIGNTVSPDEPIGAVDGAPVFAPCAGRIRGMIRDGRAVAAGTLIADIVGPSGAQVAGMTPRSRLIARGVAFAVEMQVEGWTPFSWDAFLDENRGGEQSF